MAVCSRVGTTRVSPSSNKNAVKGGVVIVDEKSPMPSLAGLPEFIDHLPWIEILGSDMLSASRTGFRIPYDKSPRKQTCYVELRVRRLAPHHAMERIARIAINPCEMTQ